MVFGLFKKKKKESTIDNRYLHLKIKEVIKETADAVSIVFEQPEHGPLVYNPGQFITLISVLDGKKVRRAYSLCSSPFLDENPTVTVKRVADGRMSNHVIGQMKVGDVIEIMEPMGSFVLDINPSNKRQIFLFGGGSGITPLLSIAKSILKLETESKVILIYANRDLESIIFKQSIEKLETEYDGRLNVIHFLEKPDSSWSGETGFVTENKLSQLISELRDPQYADTEYMTCGPEPLMNIVMDTLKSLDIPATKRHMESFVAGTTSPKEIIDVSSLPNKTVTVLLDGQEYKYEVPSGKSILEAGLDQNIDMPYSCQSGLCTACRGKCLQGKVRMEDGDGLSEEEKKEGYVLLCVGHADSDDVIVEIG